MSNLDAQLNDLRRENVELRIKVDELEKIVEKLRRDCDSVTSIALEAYNHTISHSH